MGLDTTHDCWHGPYGAFGRWREELTRAAGLPELSAMVGFGGQNSWEHWEEDPIVILLNHSDCDGVILHKDCAPLAARLEELLPLLQSDAWGWGSKQLAEQFIKGLRAADAAGEDVEFH